MSKIVVFIVSLAVLSLAVVVWYGTAGSDSETLAEPVTFNRDIAPILWENCASCHREGEAAPFVLLEYADAKKRAEQIVEVTADRFMPPWQPEPGDHAFVGERRLTQQQIDTISRWVRDGMLEGSPADRPTPPEFTEGWQLGEPNQIVQMPLPFTLPSEGTDVFRNFVIPTGRDQYNQ